MAQRKAKTLDDTQFENLIDFVRVGKHPQRDIVMLGLSFKCGLRSKEIAGLTWHDVTDSQGRFIIPGETVLLGDHITKGSKPDTKVIMHKFVHDNLPNLRMLNKSADTIMYAPRGGSMTANNVTVYLYQLYERAGLVGCSSHSGRRTFGTNLARRCNLHGGSIADVQELLRHADIRTTRQYVDPSDTQKALISSL